MRFPELRTAPIITDAAAQARYAPSVGVKKVPIMGTIQDSALVCMVIIAKSRLIAFWRKHPDARVPLETWWALVAHADWQKPSDVITALPNTSLLQSNRACFNIGGNKYRLITYIRYASRTVYVKWIGTHAAYNRINANTINPPKP